MFIICPVCYFPGFFLIEIIKVSPHWIGLLSMFYGGMAWLWVTEKYFGENHD